MSIDAMSNTGFGGSNQRKLMILKIEGILKDSLPKERNKIVADLMYETGLTEEKVKDYVRLFFRIGKIKKDEEDERMLIWSGE